MSVSAIRITASGTALIVRLLDPRYLGGADTVGEFHWQIRDVSVSQMHSDTLDTANLHGCNDLASSHAEASAG